jgi:S-adenosylmethionine synthetase
MYKLFTSESVSNGHPDKIADQISDAILDEIIKIDKKSHVACETFITTGMVLIGGELKTKAFMDLEGVVRKTIKNIGYDRDDLGFNGSNCAVVNVMGKQSQDIFDSIHSDEEQKAGDQGSVFGYATNETNVLMPAPIVYANMLMKKHYELREKSKTTWLLPDAKSQITFLYEHDKPVRIESIVFSTHHDKSISKNDLVEFIMEEIIKKTIPKGYIHKKTKYYINESGRFLIGGPKGDCGLTGRKIIADTYGGASKHGGGAFSGKDPSKIDRSAAYMSRYIAKNLVASGIAKKCEIQISYVIGKSHPISLSVDTFNTSKIENSVLCNIIKNNFDLSPKGIINFLDLLRPIYRKTSSYGHFGRSEKEFTWENIDKKSVFCNL